MASLASLSLAPSSAPSSAFPVSNPNPPSHLAISFRPFPHPKHLSSSSIASSFRTRSRVYATPSEDEWGEESAPVPLPVPVPESSGTIESNVAIAEKTAEGVHDGVAELKQSLVDSLTGTDRGLKASSEVRAEIAELITQLEAKNPTPAPTDALPLLNGKWILAYTSFSELFPLLAAGTLPLLKVGEISQLIDSSALTVENSVSFTGPLTTTSFSTSASFEVRSPKRVQIKFEEGVIGTPQLTDSIEIPESIQFLGQKIDLTPFQGLLKSLESAATSVVKTISEQPPLKFPIRTDRAQSWLLTTYLDEDLRISRGDGGSIFILVKEGSCLLEDL